jgi:hypothetical protein
MPPDVPALDLWELDLPGGDLPDESPDIPVRAFHCHALVPPTLPDAKPHTICSESSS